PNRGRSPHVAYHELRPSRDRRRARRRVFERAAPPSGKSGAANGLKWRVSESSTAARCLPCHEVVQRLPVFIGYKFDNRRVIHETEKWRLVGDQIEWIDQVTESCYDPQERVIRNLIVFPALVRAD